METTTTTNDQIGRQLQLHRRPTACTGIGDNDGDGVCADVDCDDNDPNITSQIGDACNDGDNTTNNDRIDANCNCTGAPTACTGIGDNDGDGVCADVDCDDNDPNITSQIGDACNDGDNTTLNDQLDANCNCTGAPPPAPVSAITTATASAPMWTVTITTPISLLSPGCLQRWQPQHYRRYYSARL